jgi:predicted nuclease of predicted toxin-antitoxin system
MKLLFDQNLSYRLVRRLSDLNLDLKHVNEVGLQGASDKEIWTYAKENGYSIMTFDSDFFDFAMVWGYPPKIIRFRTMNQTSAYLERLFRQQLSTITLFLNDQHLACLDILAPPLSSSE